MWNIFNANNEIESLTAQINELQSRIKEQNQTIEELTGDRDFWKSQYEEFVKTYDPEAAKLGKKIKDWTAEKMLHSMGSSIELQKLKDRVDYANQEEALEILAKAAAINKQTEILRELGDIILEIMNKDYERLDRQ